MEDHRLKAFCLVVETKSFSNAAKAKFMTQSAMSHLIKNLEDELNVKLLNRQAKTITPTSAGRLFYQHAKRILDQYKTMGNEILTLANRVKGSLQIGASTTAAVYLLPQVFYDFSRAYPETTIDLSTGTTEQILNDLIEGRVAAGIAEGSIANTALSSEEIAEDEIVVIASDDNRLTRRKKVTALDLLSQPFIMPETGSGTRQFVEDFFSSRRLNPRNLKISMTLGNPELIVQMVQSGLGIAFASKWSVFTALKNGTIKLLPVTEKKLIRKFYFVSIEREPDSLIVRTFRNFLRAYKFFVPF